MREKVGPGQMCFLQLRCWAGQAMVEEAACLTSCRWGDCSSYLAQKDAAHNQPPWTVRRQQALMLKGLLLTHCAAYPTALHTLLLRTFLSLPLYQPLPQLSVWRLCT